MIAIAIPCYNEADRLQSEVFIEFVRQHHDVVFIFVDDGSTDNTAHLLDTIAKSEPNNCRVIRFDKNKGKGEAVRQGALSAIASGATYFGYWDADLATPLSAIPDFLQELERKSGLLVVMGSRVQLLGRRIVRKRYRHYLGRVFATFASMILKLPVYDTQCGAKLFLANESVALAFKEPFISRWVFDVEIIARLMSDNRVDSNIAIYEYPLLEWCDVGGSKIQLRDFWNAFWDLGRIHSTYHITQSRRSARNFCF